ncbi:MAG: DNA translocase FtsK, partial [Bacteroidota bacterium]
PYFLPETPSEDGNDRDADEPFEKDQMFEEAARMIVRYQMGSASLLQRKLKLGYNRAGRIIDQLERVGIVGPHSGSKARDVLITDEAELERYLNDLV